MIKKYIFIFSAICVFSTVFLSSSQAYVSCLCEKEALIQEAEMIVEQIARIDEQYNVLKSASLSEEDLLIIADVYQKKKQVLIQQAIQKINQL